MDIAPQKVRPIMVLRGNLLSAQKGVLTGITVTSANIDERDSLWDIISGIKRLLLADKGLLGKDYQQQIRKYSQLALEMPTRHNMTDVRGKDTNRWIIKTRRLVETIIGQLTEQFHIQKIRARAIWHLTNRVARKVLAHTCGVAINLLLGNPPPCNLANWDRLKALKVEHRVI